MAFKKVWTAEMVTRARDLRRAGETAGLISEVILREFGVSFTVVAINNKMHRVERRSLGDRPKRPSTWAPEQDAKLRELILGGLTYAETARVLSFQFRTSFSRSRVAGRAARLGIKCPKEPSSSKEPEPKRKKTHKRKIDAPRDEPVSREILLEDLKPGECHWPHGESYPYHYCGHKVVPGSAYCPYHYKLAHTASEEGPEK